nr:N-acetylmuramic acid 6-phosphate etherase [Clostridia bacterium]
YKSLTTESVNPASKNIDKMSALEIVTVINNEDKTVPYAIEKVLPQIAEAIEQTAERLKNGGRLIYIGAGTSGRLGIIDATECPPTYGVSSEMIQGIIAGGNECVFRAAENEEDKPEVGRADLEAKNFTAKDVCMGISASGSAAYVAGALEYAKSLGALTIALSCNPNSRIAGIADIAISPEVGPEVISGSTRMKAGTAQKLVLNMISTGVMIRMGRVYGNRMKYMRPANKKLLDRAVRIIQAELGDDCNAEYDEIVKAIKETGGSIPDTVEMLRNGK